MLSKREKSKEFLQNSFDYICPICNENLKSDSYEMFCSNNHSFDISKKGVICLLNTGKFKTNYTYDKSLFIHRRRFIKNMFYDKMYKIISQIINEHTSSNLSILDLGCGEGTHDNYILDYLNKNYCFLGVDYNKDSVVLAMDYERTNCGFLVSDINNLPLLNNSIDIIINILSPYCSDEINKVLKSDGLFIKVIPDRNYLIELRNNLGFEEYEKSEILKSKL